MLDSGLCQQRAARARSAVVAIALALTLTMATSCSMMMSSVGLKLANTEWQVIAMTGFHPENVVGGTIMFTPDRVGMSNGNGVDVGYDVKWDDTGFTPYGLGSGTYGGFGAYHPYLGDILSRDEYVWVGLNKDGTITLNRDQMVVVAKKM